MIAQILRSWRTALPPRAVGRLRLGRPSLTAAVAAIGLALAACGQGAADTLAPGELEGDHAIGSPDAPITVIEYASVTCVHCEDFHRNTYPELKAQYVEPGHVRFIFRPLPTAPQQLSMAGFLLAACVGPERYFDMIDILFEQRAALLQSAQTPGGARDSYLRLARSAGLSEEQFDQCLSDQDAVDTIYDVAQTGDQYGVTGTPAFIINGALTPGLRTIEDFQQALDPLLTAENG